MFFGEAGPPWLEIGRSTYLPVGPAMAWSPRWRHCRELERAGMGKAGVDGNSEDEILDIFNSDPPL
jgi:hypothetical protein